MEFKLKKHHSIVIEMSEHEARVMADFLERMDDKGEIQGIDEVNEFEISLNNQLNNMQ